MTDPDLKTDTFFYCQTPHASSYKDSFFDLLDRGLSAEFLHEIRRIYQDDGFDAAETYYDTHATNS
jgi:hypothetical protein